MINNPFRALFALIILGLCASAGWAQPAANPGSEAPSTGLQMAVAMEQLLITAIAKGEQSVVAIARLSASRADGSVAGVPFENNPFGQPLGTFQPDPTDADFVPSEFATGVIIDGRGLVLTNFHALGDPTSSEYVVTTSDRMKFRATVKGADARSDLAVLELRVPPGPNAAEFVPITFGDASLLRKGQIVIALGNPYGIARDGQASASWGIIANLARKAGPEVNEQGNKAKPTLHHYGTLIQTDAKLNLGTSGGALLNLQGEMVGLTTSLAATAGYEQAAGYAVPVDETFLRIVDLLKQGREVEYGFLGVVPRNLLAEEIIRGATGMRIDQVYGGTPAATANPSLRPDDIVTAVNGQPIHDADGLVLHVGKLPVGAVAMLSVQREGNMQLVPIELAKYQVVGRQIYEPRPKWRGLLTDHKTALIDQIGLRSLPSRPCVVVLDVDRDSPAWEAGLRRGMFISAVEGTPVGTPDQFAEVVGRVDGAVRVRVENEATPERVIAAP